MSHLFEIELDTPTIAREKPMELWTPEQHFGCRAEPCELNSTRQP